MWPIYLELKSILCLGLTSCQWRGKSDRWIFHLNPCCASTSILLSYLIFVFFFYTSCSKIYTNKGTISEFLREKHAKSRSLHKKRINSWFFDTRLKNMSSFTFLGFSMSATLLHMCFSLQPDTRPTASNQCIGGTPGTRSNINLANSDRSFFCDDVPLPTFFRNWAFQPIYRDLLFDWCWLMLIDAESSWG